MIGKLKGKIDLIRNGFILLDVQGIGYRVYATDVALGKLARKDDAELYIHTNVKEDSITLYGFETLDELEIFELLLSISGVGPKSGLGILTIASPGTIRNAIIQEDSSILTRVSGIGKKTAERVILELKSKVDELPGKGTEAEATIDQEVIEALITMGYSAAEAREALKAVSKNAKEISEKIKLALKAMKGLSPN
ncbi:MAG: Holliday junction branch migration protein RuvA [Patescibacteria group bacterium]|nr:Holliday junction branch migration protein RuvA [Patescibacteria group bacterium]